MTKQRKTSKNMVKNFGTHFKTFRKFLSDSLNFAESTYL